MGTGVSASAGFAGSVNAAEWSKIHEPVNLGYVTGCKVTAAAGVRQVTVASGTVWALNSYHTVSGHTFALAENTSGGGRIDYIVCDINYSSGSGDASLAVIQGTPAASASVPALTRTAGSRWQVPLATVHLESGETTLTSGDVYDRRPGPWIEVNPLSPWSNYGSSFQTCAWRTTPTGDVELRGLVQTTSTITSPLAQPILTIPQGFRPSKTELFAATCRDGSFTSAEFARIDVSADGSVRVAYPESTTGTRWYSLSGIRWTPA